MLRPRFPAAATTTMPAISARLIASSIACEKAGAPKLQLITAARRATA